MNKKFALFFVMLFCASALAQDLPRIAVYVTGNVPEDEKTALGTVMLSSLINSGRYMGIERSAAFVAEIEREQTTQRSGAIDDSHISELGRQFGVRYVCIAAITPAFGSYQVSARIVDVETAVVVFIGQAFSPLRSAQDLTWVSDEVVNIMFRGQAAPSPAPQAAAPASQPQPKPAPAAQAPARTIQDVMEDGRKRIPPPPKPEVAPKPPKPPMKPASIAAIGLDVLGAGIIAYGLVENGNVKSQSDKGAYSEADKSVKNRNIAYGIGAAALIGGISIHFFF